MGTIHRYLTPVLPAILDDGTASGVQGSIILDDVTLKLKFHDGSNYVPFWETISNNGLTYNQLSTIPANSVLCNPTGSTASATTVTMTAAGRALIDDATAADQRTTLGLGTLATQSPSGTADNTNFLRGDGTWTNSIDALTMNRINISNSGTPYFYINTNGLSLKIRRTSDDGEVFSVNTGGTIDCDGLQVTTNFSAPAGSILKTYLANSVGLSVIGRNLATNGVVGDIQSNAARQVLANNAANNEIGFRVLELADLPDAGISILARTTNSSGSRSDLAPASPSSGGDQIFVENASLVFDSWIRQRRNIMRGFWEFETGNGDPSGTALADGDRLHGTPFIAQKVGNGLISQASRGSTYTRNCVTIGVYSVNDEAGIFTVDANASSNGLPVGIGSLIVEIGVRCNTISASFNDYILNLGFVSDSSPTGRGVYFQYDRATSGNVWRLVAKNSSQTTSVSSSTVAVSTEYRLRIEVTSSSLATFYVNGTSVGTVTSNIPSLLSLGAMMKRNTSSAGAVAYWDIDYIGYQLSLSTPRSSTTR